MVVVDDRTGTVTNVLDLAAGGVKGCCAVVGWQDSDTVLVRTGEELLSWRLSTGAVAQLTNNVVGSLSVGPTGCGWKMTIEGRTASCMT